MPTARKSATAAKPSLEELAAAHPLAHLVPDPSFAVRPAEFTLGGKKCPAGCTDHVHSDEGLYIPRIVYGMKDYELIRYASRTDPPENIRLYGPAGPGKTSMIMAYCATFRVPLVTINAFGGIDPNTFFGQWEPKEGVDVAEVMRIKAEVQNLLTTKDKDDMSIVMPIVMATLGQSKFHFVYSDVVRVIEQGGFLLIDEANFMGGKVSSVFNSLTDGRRFITILENGNQTVRAPKVDPDALPWDKLGTAICYNPEYEGTRPLNPAFADRFDIVVNVDYDPEVEAKIFWFKTTTPLGAMLRVSFENGELKTPVSTRKLMAFERHAIDVDLDFAIANLVASFHPNERKSVETTIGNHRHLLETDLQGYLDQDTP
jgi:MoxR-like ATPase